MSLVYAQGYGLGEIVKSETVRGRTSHLVAGDGFKAWVDAAKVASTTVPPEDGHVFDNSTTLPYDPSPQYPTDMFTEETIQPGDYEIDKKRRLSPSDSRSFKDREGQPYPGPNPKLFAKGAAHEYEAPYRDDPDWFKDMFGENPEPIQYHEFPEKQKGNRDLPIHKRDPNNPYRGADPRQGTILSGPDSFGYYWDEEGNEHDPDEVKKSKPKPHHNAQWQALLAPLLEGGGAEAAGGLGAGDLAGLAGLFGGGGDDEEKRKKNELQQEAIDESPLGIIAGLSDKYATWMLQDPDVRGDDKVARFRRDPVAEIEYQGHVISSSLDESRMVDYGMLIEADTQLRTAAWTDVREKALRLRREGKVHVKDVGTDRIYASVDGDNGTYEVMIAKTGSMGGFGGGQSITNWHCGCEWGNWAFKRRLSYVGRLCSHGYATYLEMQSRAMKNNPEHFTPKYSPWKSPKIAGIVENFKKYVDENNQGHTDQQAVDNFISILGPDEVTPQEAAQLYEYISDHLTQKAEREFDVPYTFDQDKVIKSADALRTQPKSLTPDLVFHDEDGDEEFFDDVTKDGRETTGPDQIVHFSHFLREADEDPTKQKEHATGNSSTDRMVTPGGAPTAPDPVHATPAPRKPDEAPSAAASTGGFDPSQIGQVVSTIGEVAAPIAGAIGSMFSGLGGSGFGSGLSGALSGLHFGGLTYVADADLLNRLRDLSAETPEENFGHLDSHDEEIADICDELHERGYDANRLVASLRSASYGVGNQGAGPGGAFDQPGGGNWSDLPFHGSGPDPKYFFGTSEDYVEDHEKKHRQRVDEGDGPIIKYTDPKHAPKQKPKQSGIRQSADTEFTPGPAFDSPMPNYTDTETGLESAPRAIPPETAVRTSHRGDDSDIVRQFHASGGGALVEDSGDYSDDAIVKNAQKFLSKTAGRVFSLAEQRELEDEQNPLGARNRPTRADLQGTHYV